MEEKIEIWQVGNTGLRNPNRIQEGFKAFANSPYVGNLRKENEIDFMNFLNTQGIVQHFVLSNNTPALLDMYPPLKNFVQMVLFESTKC